MLVPGVRLEVLRNSTGLPCLSAFASLNLMKRSRTIQSI